MAKDDRLPPKTGKGRMGPEMMDEDPAIVSKLSQLAGAGQEAPMGGGGGEEQSAQLLMQGAQALIQAAEMNPQLQQMVGQVVAILKEGVQGLAGGAGGQPGGQMGGQEGGGMGRGGGRKRMRPPKVEREPEAEMGY